MAHRHQPSRIWSKKSECLAKGTLSRLLDIFDLLMHATPLVLLVLKLWQFGGRRNRLVLELGDFPQGQAIHKIDNPDTSITPSINCKNRSSGSLSTNRLDKVEPASTKTPISKPCRMARLSSTPSW